MRDLVQDKFAEHPRLAQLLLDTGDALLIEGNNWGDSFWGVTRNGDGDGANYLGKILMEIRRGLRERGY